MRKPDKRGRIMEGPRGGQWTSPRALRPEVENLNCSWLKKPKKKKKK
jgi:hypothetical protein